MQSFTSSFFGRAVAVVIVLTCAPRAAPCQGQPILARLDGPSTVVLVDPVTSRERRLYDASPRGLRDLTVSPSERYVAVVHLNVADGPTASKGRPRNQLIVRSRNPRGDASYNRRTLLVTVSTRTTVE